MRIGRVPLVILLVTPLVLTTLGVVAGTWQAYVDVEPTRWLALHHDRNTHFDAALELAIAAREMDPSRLVGALDDARQWPPLHAALSGASMWIAGRRTAPIAVLPNLLAFAATALLAFDLARRLAPEGGTRIAAGLFAWATVLASPAHQAFATDLMLESLGAALSILALDAWVAWRQTSDLRAARVLALALSALLFEKYNYYVLVGVGLLAASFVRSPQDFQHAVLASASFVWRMRGSSRIRPLPGPRPPSSGPPLDARAEGAAGWRRVGLRLGLTGVALALGVAVWTYVTGGTAFEVAGVEVSLRSPSGPLTIAWAAALSTVGCAWQPWGARLLGEITPFARTLLLGHGLPVAVFGLLPGRLDRFLAYVSPTNAPSARIPIAEAAPNLLRWWSEHYSVHAAAAAIVVALAACAPLGRGPGRRPRRDGETGREQLVRAVGTYVLVGALLVLLHPHHQSRFLHTWIPVVWALAGVGLASVALLVRPAAAGPLAITAAIAWTALQAAHFGESGRSQGAEYEPHALSTRALAAAIETERPGDRPMVFVTRLPLDAVVGWIVKTSAHEPGETVVVAPRDIDTVDAMRGWLAGFAAPRVVVIDVAPDAPVYRDPIDSRLPGPDLVARVEALRLVATHDLPDHGLRVSVFESRR